MADKMNRPRSDDVFWSKLEMNSSEEDAYIPGLSAPGNKRPGRVKARKTKEVSANVPTTQPVIENIRPDLSQSERPIKGKPVKPAMRRGRQGTDSFSSKEKYMPSAVEDSGMSTTFESFAERSIRRLQKASLKDLRPEDKQRVANLIKELARVGEEKEKVVKELAGEREQYERQLMTMVEQQEKILQEREDIQEKLFQCQKLLTEYQAQLLNKQEKLNTSIHDIQEDEPRAGRQSRSREPVSKQASNQNNLDDYLTNQHAADESVSDLLLNPVENVKRPYTSLIDKEIARERSLSRGSRTSDYSRSRSASPSEGRPKFAYPQKLNSLGPLHEPLASSTQKSMEIRAQNIENESLRSRTSKKYQGTGLKGHTRDDTQSDSDSAKNRVAFNERNEYDDEAEKHSPHMKSPAQMFNDPDYAQYYKKLSPGGRKRELLKQRQALLDEQERLRKVLEKQEHQLQTRKYEYDKRKELQEQRMEFYKQGGKFPALKLDFDNGSEKGSHEGEEYVSGKGSTKGSVERGQSSDVDMNSPRSNIEIDDEVKVRSRVSMGTSPIATPPHSNKITIATSPVQSVEMYESETPRFIDVATSVSYRTPLKDTSNRVQGNLPLACNRQRSSPFTKENQEHEVSQSVRTPGEKTLNVLELVNSMEEEPQTVSQFNHSYDNTENRPGRYFTPNKYITQGKGTQSSQYRQKTSPAMQRTSPAVQRTRQGKLLNDEEESLEENKILEDIFFL